VHFAENGVLTLAIDGQTHIGRHHASCFNLQIVLLRVEAISFKKCLT